MAAPPPPPAATGYQGGGLARQITSHDIAPVESLVAQRGRDEPLREETDDFQARDLRQRKRTDTEETKAGSSIEKDSEAVRPRDPDELVFNEEGAGVAPEWTFPDGGWRAWSVVIVSSLVPRS
ncbi:uncharacterized protein JCM15063_005657 [Sporobolomyces koalae]|uniref:uncharacterized protein n=1 Tax=Sporobolomyces koalae TaxID=500713 RepID=UPI00317AD3AF